MTKKKAVKPEANRTVSNTIKKRALVVAMTRTLGNVTQSCKRAKIARSTFYKWIKEDKNFAAEIGDVENITFDFVEGQIVKEIRSRNTAMIIFYAKTKMKSRGYIEKTEILIDKVPDIIVMSDEDRKLTENFREDAEDPETD